MLPLLMPCDFYSATPLAQIRQIKSRAPGQPELALLAAKFVQFPVAHAGIRGLALGGQQ